MLHMASSVWGSDRHQGLEHGREAIVGKHALRNLQYPWQRPANCIRIMIRLTMKWMPGWQWKECNQEDRNHVSTPVVAGHVGCLAPWEFLHESLLHVLGICPSPAIDGLIRVSHHEDGPQVPVWSMMQTKHHIVLCRVHVLYGWAHEKGGQSHQEVGSCVIRFQGCATVTWTSL